MPKFPQRRPRGVPTGRPSGAPAGRRVPWQALWTAGLWLFQQGRERYEHNLTRGEQAELRQIMLKSRGRASSLTPAQRRRLGELIRKAATGG
jgi:hypothetical protein